MIVKAITARRDCVGPTGMRTKLILLILAVTAGPVIVSEGKAQAPSSRTSSSRAVKRPGLASEQFAQISRQAAQAKERNNLNEEIQLDREGLKIRPSWAEGWWDMGTALYDLDRYAEAREALGHMVALKPDGGPSWALLGLCEFELRDYGTSLAHLQRAQALGLGGKKEISNVALYHLALLMTRFEQFEAAMKTLITLGQEGEENPSIIEALGLAAMRMPFLPSEMPPDRRELVLMAGRAAFDMGIRRPTDGKKEFEDLVARYPDLPNVHYSYGTFLLNTDSDSALGEFNRELEISPNHVAARLQIAFEYIKRTNYPPGLPFAEKAVELDPKSFAAHDALGRVLLGMGETTRAVKELEAAVKIAPDSPEACFALASAYSRAGRREDAARLRAEFIRLDKMRKN